ncbi:ROK family protein [Coriobacterium glomerans PW2]|uniref:ROK family protein n=2 Tax=Coriobacterium TaxID=33870 RepID=F2N926_CORGP|nr:ROK family protein [Coriobacterium glomerans PW2]
MKRYLGIDIGGTSIKWCVLDDDFAIADRGSVPTDFESPTDLIAALATIGRPYQDDIAGVGVSAPGGFYENDLDGIVHRGGALAYMDGFPLGRALREQLGVPVCVSNDGKCCALGEYKRGALRATRVGAVLTVGTGIGGGIVIGGHVVRGAHGFAGEFSFMSNNTEDCVAVEHVFGFTGGWLALRAAILEEKGIAGSAGVDGRKLFEWIDAGDEAARRGLERYARMFDSNLLNLQAVLDPEVFAIGGGISANPALVEALNQQLPTVLAHYTGFIRDIPHPVIRRAELGNDANLYGAVQELRDILHE